MNRNIAKQFTTTLSLLDVASDRTHKYKCFHGEDIQLTVNVVGENNRLIDLSNTSVKIYFVLDKNVNEPIYRQDTGIVVDKLGIITVMLEKSYIRIGNNTLKIGLYDEDQTVFLQPLIISCIDPLIGEDADLEIPDDINVRDELSDIRRIIGDLQDFDDLARNEHGTVGRRLDNVDSQLDAIFHQVRQRYDVETDDTIRVQELFDKQGKIYFKKDTYVISKTINIKDNTFVEVHDEAIFKLADNAKCFMFQSDKNKNKGNFKWIGGTIDGNGRNQDVDDVNNENHDISRAILVGNYSNVEISNLTIIDIYGHAIGHWGNENAYFHDIKIYQNLRETTHPYGGSRRDGISGCSKNCVYENIVGFTDDDFIAVTSGYDWAYYGNPISVENVTIKNCTMLKNDRLPDYYTYRAFGFYCNDGYTIKNINVDGVVGYLNNQFIKINGEVKDIKISNVNIELNKKQLTRDCWFTHAKIENLIFNNIKINSITNAPNSFILMDLNTTIDNLTIDLDYTFNNSETKSNIGVIRLLDTSLINNIYGKCIVNLKTEQPYMFIYRDVVDSDTISLKDKIIKIDCEFSRIGSTSPYDVARNLKNDIDVFYHVISNSLIVNKYHVSRTEYSKFIDSDKNVIIINEYKNKVNCKNEMIEITLLNNTFEISPNSIVTIKNGILVGNILIRGVNDLGKIDNTSNILTIKSGGNPVQLEKYEFTNIVLCDSRSINMFEFIFDGNGGDIHIKSFDNIDNVKWINFNFALNIA